MEISKLHGQPCTEPLVETYLSVDCRTQDKDWKTNKHMGCASTNKGTADGKMWGMERNRKMQTDFSLTQMEFPIRFLTPKQ